MASSANTDTKNKQKTDSTSKKLTNSKTTKKTSKKSNNKISKKTTTKVKPKQQTKSSLKPKKSDSGDIKEASIAKFMRKRTQLVGFDYGIFKHTQFAVEFADNALDAIEKFQWDSRKALEDLRNYMDKISMDFERFDFEVQQLKTNLENFSDENFNPDKNMVNQLSKIIKLKPTIVDNIEAFQRKYRENVGLNISFGDLKLSKKLEKSSAITKITLTKFNEEYLKFITEYDELTEKYDKIFTNVNKLEKDPRFMFTMDKEIQLQNLTYKNTSLVKNEGNSETQIKNNFLSFLSDKENTNGSTLEDKTELFEGENETNTSNKDLLTVSKSTISKSVSDSNIDDALSGKILKKKKEIELEVKELTDSLDDFVAPVLEIIDYEPITIMKLDEVDAPEVLREKGERSDSYLYTFQVFDNGTGMKANDLSKFGKYLASSKSQKLRQTRGSQGFGSPSAFSDSQNTTGKPITVVSKHVKNVLGTCSEFYTTDENKKEYVIKPQDIECSFLHGTYIKLYYLNKKYKRGFVDSYIEKTALMNPHINFIFIDPHGDEHFFPRKVPYFPKEPKFALPHPSSVNIGDFQDLLRASDKLTIGAFLTENFVRMSNKVAKSIIQDAEFEIEQNEKILDIDPGYLSINSKETDPVLFVKEENRIFGRSSKSRPLKVVYRIPDGVQLQQIQGLIKLYKSIIKKRTANEKKIRVKQRSSNKLNNKKEIKEIHNQIKNLEKEDLVNKKSMKNLKLKLKNIFRTQNFSIEVEDPKIKDKILNSVIQISISKTKPSELSQDQIEYLYMAFKSKNYMAPPTDTAIPVGETALETALIKHYNLTISNRIDFFGDTEDKISQIGEFERINLISKNLSKFHDNKLLSLDINLENFDNPDDDIEKKIYYDIILELDLVHTIGDDFIAAVSRFPTSGKGLAFVVEAVMAYSPRNIPSAKKAASVVSRYVNRTPKMRDNSDCALWMGVQSVNWKNYKVSDTFDNGIPKGNYAIFINCSGPYTHLMFKSQSKNALAEDEVLLKEVKLCLETIGRSLKRYHSKREIRDQRKRKSKLIEQNLPLFAEFLFDIAKENPQLAHIDQNLLETKLLETLEISLSPEKKKQKVIQKEDERALKINEIPVEDKKSPTIALKPNIGKVESNNSIHITKNKKEPFAPKVSDNISSKSSKLPPSTEEKFDLTNEGIIETLEDKKWYTTSELVKKMRISNMMDARFLQIKLKTMASKGILSVGKKEDKKVWKLN